VLTAITTCGEQLLSCVEQLEGLDEMLFKAPAESQERNSNPMVLGAEKFRSVIEGLKALNDALVEAANRIAVEVAHDVSDP
jgi:hypothetical protein